MKMKNVRTAVWYSMAILMGLTWVIASATMSWAYSGKHGHHSRPDAASFIWHVLKNKEALNLTDDQQAKLRTIGVNFQKEKVKKTAEVELAEIDMHQLLHGDSKQAGDVESAVRKVYGLKAERRLTSIKAFQEARTVLSPEQRQKFKELRDQRHADMGRRGDGHQTSYSHSDAR